MVVFKKIIIGGLLSVVASNSFGQLSELIWADPVKLGPEINSEAYEALLVFSKDSAQLFFVREGHPDNVGGIEDQDIWSAKHNGHLHWDAPVDFKELNNKDFNAVVGMSMDGQTVYLYNAYVKKKNQLDRGIAVSHKKGNHWTPPVKVDIKNFHLEGEHYGFYVNMQETFIMISCECKGTKGQEDLYVSKRESDGSWGEPIHLGDQVNSKGYEISPYISEDTYSLFFSTDGMGGEGDADIFVSFRLDDTWTNWSTPQNLGNKINSPAFDAYFIMSQNDAYFASSRGGNSDIYHVIAREPDPIVEVIPVDTTPVITPPEVEVPKFHEFKIYYATNSSYMEKEAVKIVDEAVALMKANPDVKIEVSAHADIRADDKYNEWLTQRRANRVKDYVTLKGIDPKRIETYWHGKKDPVTKCSTCSEEEYKLSRRTIIRVYKE
jgi:outer membrane protein OmpA-like peptidoglycan-associated protein